MRVHNSAVFAAALAMIMAVGGGAGAAAKSPTARGAAARQHGHHHHVHHAIRHRADQAASAGDRHPAHPVVAHKAFGAPVWEPPPIQTPYPYDGKLAGDGVLHTGWLDSNVMRAFGVVID